MYYVYLLKDNSGRTYIGYTKDLRRRIREHLSGKTFWVRRMDKPKLYYYEAYVSKSAAQRREKNLKIRGSAYQALVKRISYDT